MIGDINIFLLLSFLICLISFLYGAFRIFKKNVPVYYKICICAVGCYFLGMLSNLVFIICENSITEFINISLLGIFGCLCFMVSANLGGDNIHEREEIKIRLKNKDLFAYVAPFVLVIVLIAIFVQILKFRSLDEAIFLLIVFLPTLPASFLSLLYLIKPAKKLQLFKYTKLCNLCILLFCLNNMIFLYVLYMTQFEYTEVFYFINSLLLAILTFDTIRGAKKWKI